jgi:hypothetical protein
MKAGWCASALRFLVRVTVFSSTFFER